LCTNSLQRDWKLHRDVETVVSWTGSVMALNSDTGRIPSYEKKLTFCLVREVSQTRSNVCIQMNIHRYLSPSSFSAVLFVVINDDNIVLADCSHGATRIFLLLDCMLSCALVVKDI